MAESLQQISLAQLARHVGGRLVGDSDLCVTSVASLTEAGSQEVSFLNDPRYASQLGQTRAAAVLVPDDFTGSTQVSLIFVADVSVALEQLLDMFAPLPDTPAQGVHASACVAENARLAENVAIGPHVVLGEKTRVGAGTVISAGCVIGREVTIGGDCYLGPNVVINQNCIIGNNVRIHGNSTIGTDGFGYRLVDGKHQKIPHIGIVIIEDDVEIGSNSCVDRAKFGKTIVGRGTKIDNLVQIAHNVKIGENCIVVSQTGIAGSSELGSYVVLGGQCGVADHIKIGTGAMGGAQCGISGDLEPGAKVMGSPARSLRSFYREFSLIQKLPEIVKTIKQMKHSLEQQRANTKDHS